MSPNQIEEPKPVSNPFDVFIAGIVPLIEQKVKTGVDEKTVEAIVKKYIPRSTTLEIKSVDSGKLKTIESAHEKLPMLLYYISKRHNVYLYGPVGSGKSTAAQQVAEALELKFGYLSLNPQTPDSRLLGFIDAGGQYRKTVFYDCYTQGGVFCIDEMDNASASLLTTLNSMLENGHGAFPDGLHERHKDFVLVATGNTNGRGGNLMFPERRPFDSAFAERFTYLEWGYDEALEAKITLSINPKADTFLTWIRKMRTYCGKEFPRLVISPRVCYKGALYLLDHPNKEEMIEGLLFKGLDKDSKTKILNAIGACAL